MTCRVGALCWGPSDARDDALRGCARPRDAVEEIYVPLAFSEESGPNTPPPSAPDLSVDASVVAAAADAAGGKLNAKDGALDLDGDTVSFTRDTDAEDAAGDGTVRYRGAVHVTARFSLVDVAVKDPRIERRGDRNVLTALVSTSYNAATDTMRRVDRAVAGRCRRG